MGPSRDKMLRLDLSPPLHLLLLLPHPLIHLLPKILTSVGLFLPCQPCKSVTSSTSGRANQQEVQSTLDNASKSRVSLPDQYCRGSIQHWSGICAPKKNLHHIESYPKLTVASCFSSSISPPPPHGLFAFRVDRNGRSFFFWEWWVRGRRMPDAD